MPTIRIVPLQERDRTMAITIPLPDEREDPFTNVLSATAVGCNILPDDRVEIIWDDDTIENMSFEELELKVIEGFNQEIPRLLVMADYLRQIGVIRNQRSISTTKRCDVSASTRIFTVQDEI